MNKRKKIILIVALITIVAVIGIFSYFCIKNIRNRDIEKNNTNKSENIRTSQLYNKIEESKEITFKKTLDENNKIIIVLKDNNGYKEVISNGNVRKYVVKDGDTYYLDESNKKYYKYQSNDMILTEIKEQFEELNQERFSIGKEKIQGKTYNYEEISECQSFLMNDEISVNNLEYAKTRLYYDNENLVYIKTIVGENEEIIKVEISYKNVDDKYFNIPEDYKNGRQ